MHPHVSVLMSVYNDSEYLDFSVSSILEQTYRNFELVIINDGSNNKTRDKLLAFRDPRLQIIHNDSNLGLTSSLIRGVSLCSGTYLARLDADEIAMPDRLEKQVAYLDRNPHIGILGARATAIDQNNHRLKTIYKSPRNSETIRFHSLFMNPFFGTTVMVRKSVLTAHSLNYDPTFKTAQDYDLWSRVLENTQGYNLKNVLVATRIRPGITQTKKRDQRRMRLIIASRNIAHTLKSDFSEATVKNLINLFYQYTPAQSQQRSLYISTTQLYLHILSRFLQFCPHILDRIQVQASAYRRISRALYKLGLGKSFTNP
jgi:glycosyltransferase involved in cell wall biosynthesis